MNGLRMLFKKRYFKFVAIGCSKSKHDVFKMLENLLTELKIRYTLFSDTMFINYKKAHIIVDIKLYEEIYIDKLYSHYDIGLDELDIKNIINSNTKKKAFNIMFNKKECIKWLEKK